MSAMTPMLDLGDGIFIRAEQVQSICADKKYRKGDEEGQWYQSYHVSLQLNNYSLGWWCVDQEAAQLLAQQLKDKIDRHLGLMPDNPEPQVQSDVPQVWLDDVRQVLTTHGFTVTSDQAVAEVLLGDYKILLVDHGGGALVYMIFADIDKLLEQFGNSAQYELLAKKLRQAFSATNVALLEIGSYDLYCLMVGRWDTLPDATQLRQRMRTPIK